MVMLKNAETEELKKMSISEFAEWFNSDFNGHVSSTWKIVWVQYEHPGSK